MTLQSSANSFDVIVIGGGIHGIFTAVEASRRGLRTLLLERQQFGCGTSQHTLRIIHGGLRYLQEGDAIRYRESAREQDWFLAHLPHLVTPLSCLMPLYNQGIRRKSVMRVVAKVNNGLKRLCVPNRSALLAPSRVLSVRDTVECYPTVRQAGLVGGFQWHDVFMPNPGHVMEALLRFATRCGAVCLDGQEVDRILVNDGKVVGVACCTDAHRAEEYAAPVVVNCAGPWSQYLARGADLSTPDLFHPSIAFNLKLKHPPISKCAIAATAGPPPSATYFVVPEPDGLRAGTFHLPWRGEFGCKLPSPRPANSDVLAFVDELNLAFPELELNLEGVREVCAGYLPARTPGGVRQAARTRIHLHAGAGGPEGLVTVSGIKFTTARHVASVTIGNLFAEKKPLKDYDFSV